ncbi:nickel/cobalt ABC transporter permease [Paenibacillus gallinarum]|uniref:ABC transporter permease subunit n=1 Tax=Paenibacillus gallinarum TaxID=2762232 RepID=A0ABR8T1C1_9BACL|nr:nickel/cobalt ABC transporter permease [Paenibacillus gallinarum]MBD7969551.1 ABC transporter permease subunit [Paenibacillus gallinarum]
MGVINRLKKDRLAMVCIGFLFVVILAGVFAPMIAPHNPIETNVKEKFAGMSMTYPLGTDQLGRCILSRLLYGIRTTVFTSLLAMAVTIIIGTILGVIAGISRGKVDELIMRICDVFLSFPSEVMILAIVGMMGPGLFNVIIASIIAKWAWYTRMIRTIVLKYTDKNYIRFAKVSGCSTGHIVKTHILPGAAGEIAVLATLDTGSVILVISALSFLGLGVQAPTPEWGMMLNEAKNVMIVHPYQMLAPGIAILLVVAAFHFVGDSLQDAFDTKRGTKKG